MGKYQDYQDYQELNLNEENHNWLNLLINNEADERIFNKHFKDNKNVMDGVLKFRDFLLKGGNRGSNLTEEEITASVKSRDKEKLKVMLSEIFLEPITNTEIENYIDLPEEVGNDIIKLHFNHKELRFSSVLIGYEILRKQDKRKELKKQLFN